MDKEKLNKILISAKNASNNDLITASKLLEEEFDKTKKLIIDLTHHLDSIEDAHVKINEEYKKRFRPQ
jgi:galactitol-specific phosphotransferase system IIB component